jgi:hypothetical protein
MGEYYNQYISNGKEYISEICFVKINVDNTKNIVIRDHSYAKFKGNFKNMMVIMLLMML